MYSRSYGLGVHVVEQDDIGARFDDRLEVGEVVDLHFDLHGITHVASGPSHGCTRGTDRLHVVVLDEHRVEKPYPVVLSATRAYGSLFQEAKSGRGLARVDDRGAGANHCVHKSARGSRDA